MKAIVLGLFTLLLLGGSACTHVGINVQKPNISRGPIGINCKLQRELRNQEQQTDFWCWAASAHTVMEYMKKTPIEQCNLVTTVFRTELDIAWQSIPGGPKSSLAPPDCCMATAKFPKPSDPDNVQVARNVCRNTGWPEMVFAKANMHFDMIPYDWGNTGPQGMDLDEIAAEICADRPIISAVAFEDAIGGGAHTVVIGGYSELEDGSQWVHVYDPGYSTLEGDYYLWPYEVYLGDPGVFTHVRDYKNLFPL